MADEAYLRESIMDPRARQVDGYEALMPTYRGLVGEEALMHLIEYLKSRKRREQAGAPAAGPAGDGRS